MKRCVKCGIEKAASEFNKNKSSKDGLYWYCKGCRKLHYEANKEQIREQRKLYYEANKEQILEYKKLYREANKEQIKLYNEANKECKRAYDKLYHAKDSRRRDERYIKARMKNGYTREEAVILRGIYKSVHRGEQNRDTCDQLFMAGLI